MRSLLRRLKPESETARAAVSAAGGGFGIAMMLGLAELAGMPVSAVPFATSIVLVMSSPDVPQSQPRSILGGHVLSALAGFIVLWLAGAGGWLPAVSVALAIFLMQLTGTLHPPAAINALLVTTLAPKASYLLVPTASGAAILVAFAYVYHGLTHPRPWPQRWL